MRIRSVAVDFDGTIFDISRNQELKPINGVKETLTKLQSRGVEIVIYTCRTTLAKKTGLLREDLEFIENTLNQFEIPFSRIETEAKPIVDAYIDDKAIRFERNWKDLYEILDKL